MRKAILGLLLLLAIGAGAGYIYRYPIWEALTGHEAHALQEARRLIDEGRPRDALNWLNSYTRQIDEDSPIANQWRALYLEAAIAAKDSSIIVFIYDHDHHVLNDNEDAALLAADYLLKAGRPTEYDQLRQTWNGKQTKESVWFNLDADKLLIEGNRTAAIALLGSHAFEGKADSGRLVRLALLTIKDNPRQAWEYLAEAYAKDPENPEIRSYRARLLEVVGQTGLALNEYIGATQSDPKAVFYQDQLAEFYRRNNRYDLALNVWKDHLSEPESEQMWLKAWFWSRVIVPFDLDWSKIPPPSGNLTPFLTYLAALKPGTFWDQKAFEKLANNQNYLERLQVTFWLRLLNACQQHNENGAWELLQYNHFATQSWNLDLESLLRRVLTFRKIGTFNIDEPIPETESILAEVQAGKGNRGRHPLYVEVDELSKKGADIAKITPGLREVLSSDIAIPSCFLVAGWLEAALDLTPDPISIPADMPDWVYYDYAQAIRAVRGNKPALDFARQQKPIPSLTMLIGELLIASGDLDAGAEKLRELSSLDSDVGLRSAWLLALMYTERKQYDQARAVIEAQPLLKSNVLGKEAMARIALLEGKTDEADKIYAEIEGNSTEAKSYLARQAFVNKDYKKAKELTEELLRLYPNNPVLRDNYQRIMSEQTTDNTPENAAAPQSESKEQAASQAPSHE